MTAPLVQRLSLVVDAATGQTETRMDAVAASSRDMGEAAERSASQVAAAADRVAAAQLKRDDAAGKVTVAEARLLEVQQKGNASASQLAAATERLESARRGLAVSERQLEAAQATSAATQRGAAESLARQATETERVRGGSERLRGQLDSVKGAAAGLTAFALGDWLRDSVEGYLEGAKGAQALATSMNASVEEGGRLTTIFAQMGLEADDLLEIQAQFASTSKDGLTAAGQELKTNRDGTVNWARSLEDTLAWLQKVPDATERNRLGFQMFGEEGYKQLSRLLTSGMSVEEAFKRVGTPFTDEDVQIAQDVNREMGELSLASADAGRTIAREVLPVITALMSGVGQVAGLLSSIPAPFAAAAGAAILLGRTGFDPLAKLSELASTGMERVRGAVGSATEGLESGAGRMARAGAVAKGAVGGLTEALGGPLGIALIAAGALFSAASQGEEDLEQHAATAAAEVERLGGTSNDAAANVRRLSQQLDEQAGYWERVQASTRGLNDEVEDSDNWFLQVGQDLGFVQTGLAGMAEGTGENEHAQRGFADAIAEARKELGEYGAQTAAAQLTQESLTQLIAEGDTTSQEFAGAVRDAADAEMAQSTTSDTASAAIAAYRSQTDQAVVAVRGLIDAQLAQQDANYGFLSAMDAVNAATDDAKTSVDEVAQAHTALQEAALRAGDAAADAAVAQARAAGSIVTPLDEANVRATTLIGDLQAKLNTPGLGDQAKADLQGLIDRLTEAQQKGDVNALVTLTGVDTAKGELDETTGDRETHVNVESRGGPAVDTYLDSLTADRLAIIRAESRGGPAVDDYLARVAGRDRLAIIRVETRGGPDVDTYLDNLASNYGRGRTAVIDVQSRGGTGAAGGGGTGAGLFGAGAGGGSTVIQQLIVQPQVDSGGRLTAQGQAEAGRGYVAAIRAYEQQNGPGWRRTGR